MTPQQIALVQQSFSKVAPISEAAAVLFYDRLFDVAPSVRAMFPEDMTEQRKKLMGMLAAVVSGLSNLETILPAASALAKRHVAYGAKAEHYPVVGATLLWTLEKGLGEAWTPELATAWTDAYGVLSGYMISKPTARRRRPPNRRCLVSEPLVIVGNGMAAARLVDELAKTALGRYAVAVIGEEPRLAYNRVLLSSVLAGETGSHEIELRPADWWRHRGVTVRYGYRVTEIDTGRRELKIAGEESMEYSKLVLATGSTPLRLNVPGADLAGVHTFRDTRDVDLLLTLAAAKKRVVVVGGGLLGLEAAYGLAKAGAPVTLLHLMDRLMERQLDGPAADLLKTLVERKGIRILLNASTARIHGERHVEAVELADGSRIEADAVIFAAGIRPNIALAKEAGIAVNRGIVVNDEMQTASPDIYALGECAEHRGTCYGLVEPAYEQARVLARHLGGRPAAYQGSVVSTNLKVSGVSVFSAGDFMGGEGSESLVLTDRRRGTYKKLVIADGCLTGAVLIGDTADALWYLELIRTREKIAGIRADMMFGRALALPSKAA